MYVYSTRNIERGDNIVKMSEITAPLLVWKQLINSLAIITLFVRSLLLSSYKMDYNNSIVGRLLTA